VVELNAIVTAQAATIVRLEAKVAEQAEQAEEIAVLKRRLAADSHNSSRPVCHEREGGARM
jgi:hypothetical protein